LDDFSFFVGMIFGMFIWHFVFLKIIMKPSIQRFLRKRSKVNVGNRVENGDKES